ncbi:hypothetical protein DXT89_22395, partial [Agrobacterium vitis]
KEDHGQVWSYRQIPHFARRPVNVTVPVHLLPEWTLPQGGIYAVFPPARFRPAKVRSFIDMLMVAERKRKTAMLPTGGPS